MLAWTIYLSFLGAVAVTLAPARQPLVARLVALLTTIAGLGLALLAALHGNAGGAGYHHRSAHAGYRQLGIEYRLAADGISLAMVLLTGIAAVAGVLFSWNVEERVKEYFAFYLILIGAVYGVFLSFDLFLLFVFYEIAIVPKYFLIAIWGSNRREYAAMKLVLYSFAGSALVLAVMVAAYVVAGQRTMNLEALARFPFPLSFQLWAFPLAFVGFAVLAGMWPFHTWAPTGHAAAPTAASMLLAGVVMKLGAYGCLRVAMLLFPRGLEPWRFHVAGFASWQQVFALFAVVGIVYAATVALIEKDLKLVVGYSSVSHMGFVLLGLLALNQRWISRRRLPDVFPRHHRRSAVRSRGPHDLRPDAHPGHRGVIPPPARPPAAVWLRSRLCSPSWLPSDSLGSAVSLQSSRCSSAAGPPFPGWAASQPSAC